jgi:leucyl-tRNA synthetase
MMIFSNLSIKKGKVSPQTAEAFIRVLSPFAPHLAEEIWRFLGHKESIANAPWPTYDDSLLQDDSFEYPVMINGKLRFKIMLALDMEEEEIRDKVLTHETALKWTEGKPLKRFILVPQKIINIVV